MIWLRLLLVLVALAPLAPASAQERERAPMTILVSIDGFRPDFLDRGLTPNLNALAARGVRAAMRPSFPTKTFPNHQAIVTGLRPDRNGIVDNVMEDARLPGVTFRLSNEQSVNPFWWQESEPIWTTAERAGIRTATMFWPGSEVPHDGILPSAFFRFYQLTPSTNRVETVLDWVRRPADIRPRFITLYFDTIDLAAHDYPANSPELAAALAEVDARIGDLIAGLDTLGQRANLIIVSDHGMAPTSAERVVPLASLVDPAAIRLIADGVFATMAPVEGREAEVDAALIRPHDHATCWRHGEFPARFHYGNNPRVPPYFCLAEVGWLILRPGHGEPHPGNHGYDNDAPDMRALFIAAGPAFRPGTQLPVFDNVDVYPLLARLIGVEPRPNDGTIEVFTGALTN